MVRAIHAVVLSWNRFSDTCACIESLRASTTTVEAIWAVDNASPDGSGERLATAYKGVPTVRLLRNPANYGFARGCNVGIRAALKHGAEAVLLVNNDAVLASACLEQLAAAMEQVRGAGLCGPRIFFHGEPDRIWLGGGYFARLKTDLVAPEKGKVERHVPGGRRCVTFLTGCVLLVRREVFEHVGLLDEDCYLYAEDFAFALAARRAGFRLVYEPRAHAWHKVSGVARDRSSPLVMYHLARSRVIVLRKYFTTPYLLYGLLVHALLFTPHRLLQVARGSRSWRAAWAWIAGTWAGLTARLTPPPR